ncbi:MAG: nicotinate-nucleotide adenylyltransferase [Bryobacteraceae bacterium]
MPIAIFGGTFDPIHKAHLTVAQEAADAFALERVLFVPAGCPPHKSDSTGAAWADRFHMVELVCAADPRFEPSRLEEGEQKSYSILTIEKVRAAWPDELYFILGADAFAEIATWHRWRDVVASTRFIVVTRPGHSYAAPEGARVDRLDTLALPVSSSDIRRRLALGEMPDDLPPAVGRYIVERGLYDWPAGPTLQ